MKVQGKFKMQAHITSGVVMDIAAFKVSHCVGSDIDATTLQAEKARSAMDEMSQKVQNASSHPWNLPHTQGTRSIQRGNGTLHAWVRFSAKLTLPCHDTPPTVSIPLGPWNVYTWVRFAEKLTPLCHTTHSNGQSTRGAMDEG